MGTKRIIVHEIVVNLRIPPYTKRWFKEDDKISIDICLLFALFQEKVNCVELISMAYQTLM